MENSQEKIIHPYPPKQIPQDPKPTLEDAGKVTECPACKKQFGITRHKYHCTACGKVFCKECCDDFLLLPASFQYDKVTRTCGPCFKKYNYLDFSRTFDLIGPEDAPSIVVLPGALCGRVVFDAVVKALPQYRFIGVDLPGLGARRGEKLTNEASIEVIKDIILNHTKEKKAMVFGYSMGGHLAMKFAHAHPELCTSLILGGCVNEYYGFGSNMFFSGVKFVYDMCSNETKSKFVPDYAPKTVSLENLRPVLASGMYYDKWEECGNIMKEPHEGFYRKALASLDMPILFIHGSKDFRTKEKEFLASCKKGEMQIIEGMEHIGMMDPNYKDIAADKIREFVVRVYPVPTDSNNSN